VLVWFGHQRYMLCTFAYRQVVDFDIGVSSAVLHQSPANRAIVLQLSLLIRPVADEDPRCQHVMGSFIQEACSLLFHLKNKDDGGDGLRCIQGCTCNLQQPVGRSLSRWQLSRHWRRVMASVSAQQCNRSSRPHMVLCAS
jgi:hypothetical protein